MCDHCQQMCKEVFKCDFQSEFEHIRPSDEQELVVALAVQRSRRPVV